MSVARAFAVALLVAGCHHSARPLAARGTTAPEAQPPREARAWVTKLDRDHPLVGAIYDVRGKRFVSRADVDRAMAGASIVLLGEKHDNPDHHVLQASLLEDLLKSGRTPAVAFEMIDADEQGAVTAAAIEHPKDADAIAEAVHWDGKGWPPWPEYAPIFRVAVAHELPILGANLPMAKVRAIARGGLDALPADEVDRLRLREPLAPDAEKSLEDELRDAHCGHLPEHALAPMALAQRARDQQMASILERARRGAGAVLIAGDGHVRRDRGVPAALATIGGDPGGVVSIAFVEVERDERDPGAYASRWHAASLPFDFVWFTPRANDDDPCAAFRRAK